MLRRYTINTVAGLSRAYSTQATKWQDMDFSVPFRTKLELSQADPTPRFDEIVAGWEGYPGVQNALRQINDQIFETMKDQDWAELRKQFKTETATIDWSFVKENFPFPSIVADAQKAVESYAFPDVDLRDYYLPELLAASERMSADLRADYKDMQAVLPELELEMARTKYVEENIDTINMADERKRMPEIFAQIDKELAEMNWDTEPHVMPKFGEGWPKHHHH